MVTSTQQHWIESRYGPLFAQSWTPANAKPTPLILLHGALGCVSLWAGLPQSLAEVTQHRVIAYDRPGYGRSAGLSSLLPDSFIDDEPLASFTDILDHFQVWDFAVFGQCVGAAMAIGCAVTYPRACKAVITEPTLHSKDALLNSHDLHKHHGDKTAWVLRNHARLQANYPTTLEIRSPLLRLCDDNSTLGGNLGYNTLNAVSQFLQSLDC
jgi:pimeloyl-ACP methyl ester carboxylesterase